MALGLGIGTRRLRDRNPQSATPAPAPPTESFGFAAALWRTRRYLLPELRHFLIFAALSGVAMLLQLAASLVGFDLLTNKVFLGEPLTALQARLLGLDAAEFVTVEELGQDARLTLRTAFLLLTGMLLVLGFVLGSGLGYYLTWILQRVNQHLRLAMMDSAVHLSLRRSDSRQVGDAIYRVYQDSAMVTSVVRNALVAPAVAFFNLLVAVGAVSFFSLYLGMLFLVAAAPALLLAWAFTPRLRTLSSKARAANSELTSHIQESVGGVRLLKACRAELSALEGFRSRSTTALDRAYELRRAVALLGVLVYICAALAALAADYLMVRWVWAEAPTFGYGLVAFIGFAVWNLGAFQAAQERLSAISGTGVSLAATWCVLQDMSVGLKRAFFLLDAEPEVVDKPDALPMPALGEGVRFEGVRFGYAADRPVLDGATFHAQPGTTVAIVGPSGAGKSTLLSLLLRLYEVDGGGVRVGGSGRPRHSRARSARCHRHRAAGKRAVSHQHCGQHPLRRAKRHRSRGGAGRLDGVRGRVRGGAAGRLRHRAGRTRREALGRSAAAAFHRPRRGQGRADTDIGRTHRGARCGHRTARARTPRRAWQGEGDFPRHAPHRHHPSRRSDSVPGERAHRRTGAPRRADGHCRRALRALRAKRSGVGVVNGGLGR